MNRLFLLALTFVAIFKTLGIAADTTHLSAKNVHQKYQAFKAELGPQSNEEFIQSVQKSVPGFFVRYPETLEERWRLGQIPEPFSQSPIVPPSPVIYWDTYDDDTPEYQAQVVIDELIRRDLDSHFIKAILYKESNDVVNNLARLNNLQQLHLVSANVDVEGLKHLSEMPALSYFHFATEKLSVPEVEQIARSKTIRELRMSIPLGSETPATELLRPLQKMTNLRTLCIPGGDLDEEALQVIAGIPFLESLEIENVIIPRDGLNHLARMRFLRHFSSKRLRTIREEVMSDTYRFNRVEGGYPDDIECVDYSPLKRIPTLKSLTLSQNLRSDQIRKYGLSELTQLQEICNCPRLDHPLVFELNKLPKLETIRFSGNKRHYKSLEFSQQLPGLKKMEIGWVSIPDAELAQYLAYLPEHQQLQELQINSLWVSYQPSPGGEQIPSYVSVDTLKPLSEIPELRILRFNPTGISTEQAAFFDGINRDDHPVRILKLER
ncbi:MAG: hypothetical protein KDA65_03175 [Planctomycetaceae bacterium]|nr:hypothetical protein [Planctomycetaceae bacterium]